MEQMRFVYVLRSETQPIHQPAAKIVWNDSVYVTRADREREVFQRGGT